jgi:predicted  nucleic acid-binding Zn-ribbon protein
VSDLTLEPLSQARWESRIKHVKAAKFQTTQIRDALLQLEKTSEDLKTKKMKLILKQPMRLKVLNSF